MVNETGGVEIQQLRCFAAVAEELHFGRAAERLHMTASPVSRMVKDLERELEAELFVRRYHQIELTAAGRELVARVTPLLDAFDRLKGEVRRAAADDRRTVRLGGSHYSPPRILDEVVECAREAGAGPAVDVRLAPSSELLAALFRSELDAAVVHLPVDDPGLRSMPLAAYRFHVAMRRDDVLAGRDSLAVADLADRVVLALPLSLQPATMQLLRDVLITKGVCRLRALDDPDPVRLAGQVRRSRDLTLTLSPATGGSSRLFDDPAFTTIPLIDGPEVGLGLAWRADRAGDPAIAGLLAAVEAHWTGGAVEI
ncbi:DNA-binding transcriptional LysR family regulator [Catenuloplanes nepalensis]|uniref:DNA-binding transcriptional LysR family regulator n=1 Tax=Catenuloplanes nepalensis TaxID=587533 RepID=A0ABT9MNJ2_9ACTN|nr:LysR family transcriptional regulator [Catenuloplanes nepalensis]MDP9792972.1 DNA-binding transcriptional LysR family regulator [Catenuloplanes nepalensis]